MKHVADGSERSSSPPAAGDRAGPGPLLDDRYQATTLHHQGPRLAIWSGTDRHTGAAIVIRLVPIQGFSESALLRLQHEARQLERLHLEESAALWAWGTCGHQFYMVRPHLAGQSLRQLLRTRRLTARETVDVGCHVLSGLAKAHEYGLLHHDVRPETIVVVGQRSGGLRASLVDFVPRDLAGALEETSADVACYTSPERAGLLEAPVGEPSDLYSLGLVLYECLAGRPPFRGTTLHETLRQHMTASPPDLYASVAQLPPVLEEMLQRLLKKDPQQRYQTARGAWRDFEVLARSLEQHDSYPELVVGQQDRRRGLTEAGFVGRRPELKELVEFIEGAGRGEGNLMYVEAVSGVGKSRLLTQLQRRAAASGFWVLEGQSLADAGQRPLQVLDGIVDAVLDAARQHQEFSARLQAGLGEQREAVAVALPQLAGVLGTEAAPDFGGRESGERATLQALAALFDLLGSTSRPALIVFDDFQWADEQAVRLLELWTQRTLGGGQRYVSLIVAFRSDEVEVGHRLRTIRPARQMKLSRLSAEEIENLVTSMAGRLPQRVTQLIQRLAEGSPFMASALLRGLWEAGTLHADEEGWHVDSLAIHDIQSSQQAAQVLARRIGLLPDRLFELLQIAAVLGKECDTQMVARIAGISDPGQLDALFAEARHRHLVWAQADSQRLTFVHDRLREAFLEQMPAERRRQICFEAARYLEQHQGNAIFDLAYFYDAAGRQDQALPFALQAAQQARQQYSLKLASQQYEIAFRGCHADDAALRFRIAEGMGEVLMLSGEYRRAEQWMQRAHRLAADVYHQAAIDGMLGELAFKQGDMAAASHRLERALGRLGHTTLTSWSSLMLGLLQEISIQTLHSLFPRWFVARRNPAGQESRFLAMRLYSRLGYAYWFGRGWMHSLWAHLAGMNLAERYPESPELAQAYSEHAVVFSLVPRFPQRGIRYAEKSYAIRQRLGDTWGQGQSLHFHGVVLYAAAQYEASIEKCRRAIELLRRTGDFWEVNIARFHIAASLFRMGQLQAAADESRAIHRSGLELGDIQASGIGFDIWAKASPDRLSLEAIEAELQRTRNDVQGTCQILQAKGAKLLSVHRASEAAEAFEQARRLAENAGIQNVWTAPQAAWQATALREQADAMRDLSPRRRERIYRRAERAARRALRTAWNFPTDLPHALRERGLLLVRRGRTSRGLRLLHKSILAATRQHAQYEAALSQIAHARIRLELGDVSARGDLSDAEERLHAARYGGHGRPPDMDAHTMTTISLADRFHTMLDSGRRVAAAMTPAAILHELEDAALRLLRAETCRVVELDPDNPQPEKRQGVSADMVARAVQAKRALAFVEETEGSADEGLVLRGAGSALCAPITMRGRVVACLYASHRHVVGLFGEEEERLVDFLVTITGAALENVENLAELKRLNATLENRVAERTADAEARAQELLKSNEELEQFAYVVSHDMQEPLRTVSSFCQLLQRRYADVLDDTGRDFIRLAVEGSERMKQLITDLLTYSRVGTKGKMLQPADSGEALQRALFNLQATIEQHQATITHDELPAVMADPTQMTQLFQNLIGNAIKFRRQTPPRIHVGVEGDEKEWIFSVQDNGIGIDPEHFERIFLVFQRLHHRHDYAGTGIGLAVCRKTVERHGGRIWVESTPGRGSTFYFSLPCRQARS